MPGTALLALPLLVAEQAQKHVTHNEALTGLDAIVMLSVVDRDLSAPPGSPAEGARYIPAATATGAWAGHEGEIAAYQDAAWNFYEPAEGWLCWVADEDLLLVHDGADWGLFAAELQNVELFGLGTTADGTNPFSAKLNKALWTAKTAGEGGDGDLRYTMNKETAADVLSLLLQRGFSGRAELGLIGDDDFIAKVSADGSTWFEAFRIDKDTGDLLIDAGVVGATFTLGMAAPKTNISAATTTLPQEPTFQKRGTDAASGSFAFIVDSNTAGTGPDFRFCKGSASGGAASSTSRLGQLMFNLNDGTNYLCAAMMRGEGDGVSVATDVVSGRLTFWTNSGANAPTERLRIDKDGVVSHRANAQVIVDAASHLQLRSYTVAGLPSAATAGQLIYVSNGTSNKRLAVSDGTNWRWPDGAIVS